MRDKAKEMGDSIEWVFFLEEVKVTAVSCVALSHYHNSPHQRLGF